MLHSFWATPYSTTDQERHQGVYLRCGGGGGAKWQNVSLSTAELSGGRGFRHLFFRPNFLWQNYYHYGVGVLSLSPCVTELTSQKQTNKQTQRRPKPWQRRREASQRIILRARLDKFMVLLSSQDSDAVLRDTPSC